MTRNMQTGEPLEFRQSPASRYGAPHYFVHRADLLNILASGVDPTCLHLDSRVTDIEERQTGITLTFADGTKRQADVVIGADGVHSAIRRALYGEDHPTYTGQSVWRSLLKGSDVPPEVLEPSGSTQWWGPGCHLVSYYLRGREVVNVVTQDDTDKWVEEGWSLPGDPDEMSASFPNPEPRLKTLLSLVTQCSRWGLFTRPLTSDWGQGCIQLIGDAAHAMLPNAGQGAGQAFEDAYTLARWLDAERNDPVAALQNFRRIRIPRVHGVQLSSLAAARMKHMRDRDMQKDRLAKGAGNISLGWILEYDPVASWDKLPVVPAIE
jgi:salicylate hydroxylase